jgi:hypothetical protein
MFADFPCSYEYQSGMPVQDTNSRISYCISFIGRHVISGGGIYAAGESINNEFTISSAYPTYEPIHIKRVGKTIFVNEKPLENREAYNWWKAGLTLNPWVINTAYFEVRNMGALIQNEVTDTIYVEGEIREGWIPNPFGLILMAVGIYLIRRKNVSHPGVQVL